MAMDLKKSLETTTFTKTITCRVVEHGAVYKTVLSEDDSTFVMRLVSAQTGKLYKDALTAGLAIPYVENWLGRKIKMLSWNPGNRILIYHD